MTEMKATRATITLGTKQLDGFMLPDGSYRMSQTQAACLSGAMARPGRAEPLGQSSRTGIKNLLPSCRDRIAEQLD
jgi:hypothetical protein